MKTILVLYGGISPEHEVSIASAKSVIQNLNTAKYKIKNIYITKSGDWLLQQNKLLGQKAGNNIDPYNWIKKNVIDVIFPVLHGPNGEDGSIQGLCELTSIAYVGCDIAASANCMDKVLQKKLCATENIPQTKYTWYNLADWNNNKTRFLDQIKRKLDFPVFIKPARAGSSIGVTKVGTSEQIPNAITNAFTFDSKVIMEEGVREAREIEIAILGNENPQASVCGEIIPSNEFYDYDAKYIDGKSEEVIPADLPQSLAKQIQQTALKAYQLLGCSGLARVDFLLNSNTNKYYLNEVNTMPGFTEFSMYPKLWQASGLEYSKLLDHLIRLALKRHKRKLYAPTFTPSNPTWHLTAES